MRVAKIFILIPFLAIVSLISACDGSNSELVEGNVDSVPLPAIDQSMLPTDSVIDEDDCLDEPAIDLLSSASEPRFSSIAGLSCSIK